MPKAKPYSLGWTMTVGLAVAISFAVLSLFFLYMQAQGTHHRISGEVIAITPDSVTVKNAHGDITLLVISSDAELRGMTSHQELDIGQHIMMRGQFLDGATFEVDRMRVLTDGPAE